MNQFRFLAVLLFTAVLFSSAVGQTNAPSLLVEPFVNRVFIEERGQFKDKLERQGLELEDEVLFALENSEYNAYFTHKNIIFRFPERKVIPKGERVKLPNEPEERGIETTWHSVVLNWLDANQNPEVLSFNEAHEYYNYTGLGTKPNINFVPAFNQLTYKNVYDGVDMVFELPQEGGIKYRFEIAPGTETPAIKLSWDGAESVSLDDDGNLLIKSLMTLMKDMAPTAETSLSKTAVPISYALIGNEVRFNIEASSQAQSEGFIIDPWVVNTSYPDVNRAHDIQEDAAGNIVVHGNHTNYQVQKFNSTGVLQWTYITASTFLGDIAVDDPGNVYIVGGYAAGKRQKLDPSGVQQWVFPGLVEEWRLAFNYSKTVLTVGGYFVNPGGNNLARLDLATGAVSNQIVYGLETRSIATDCNGDMFALHVTFGGTGTAAGNVLIKTNADFTTAGSVPSGFLLSELEPTAGYAPNPSYNTSIYQGFNGLVVSGNHVYMSDGVSIRRVDKQTLGLVNTGVVPGGQKLMNSGLSADVCGNIYAGTQNGIAIFDSTLAYQSTIATPGDVYDIITGSNGELLVCGDGFIGSFPFVCNPPPAITATANNACDGTGSIEISVAGGLSPYTYEWLPGGQTTNPITGLPAGVYTYVVNDAFCRTYIDSIEIYETPSPVFTPSGVNTVNTNPASICLGETFDFSDNSTASDGSIISWEWDFGDGATSQGSSPTHLYATAGTYDVKLVVTTDLGCVDSLENQVFVDPLPQVDFAATAECFGNANSFTDATIISSGSVASWSWDFGDGATAAVQNPTHQYASTGTFVAELIATSANGCFESFQTNVDVYDLPQPDFTFPATCVNDPTDLIDNSTDGDWPINSWTWNTDGVVLNGSTVQHTFSAEGGFPVQLIVSDQFGCVDSITQQLTISVRPQIALSVIDDCAGEQFVFTNTSTIPSGTIDVSDWDLGDGNTSTTFSPTNTYSADGTYNVTLQLISDLGCAADTAFQVTAYPNPAANFTWQNQCEGTAIVLNETTTVPAPGQLLLSDWTLGNGTILNDTVLTAYTYAGYGDYTITLDTETQDGCTDSESYIVSAHATPTANFSFTDICETDSVLFTDQSAIAQGNIVDWQWDFGNGQTSNTQIAPYQIYPADGIYPIQITVTSDSGCAHVFDDVIEIFPSPVANFSFDSVCFPLAVQFTDLTNPNGAYPLAVWAWEFTDGQTSSVASPAINFAQFGAYGATLTVTNLAGCKDEITLGDALVHPVPVAAYSSDLKHCFEETMTYADQSTLEVLSDDQIALWQYSFGDGANANGPDGTHDYLAAGFYDFELEVTTNHGCQDVVLNSIEVYPLPEVAFDANPKEGCNPLSVQFLDQSTIPAPYSLTGWQWNLGDSSAYPANQNPYYLYNVQNLGVNDFASYGVSVIVTSGNGCTSSLAIPDLITVHPVPYALFSVDPDNVASIIDPIFGFTDLSTENVTSWSWTFGDGLSANQENPSHSFVDVGTYRVSLAVETDFGCSDTVSYSVIVEPQFTFYIPNAFTPNADGVNDEFFGSGEHIITYGMQVFDRWGEIVFESNEPDFKWDGSYKGKQVEAGQYVFKFVIIDWQRNRHDYSGSVMLLR